MASYVACSYSVASWFSVYGVPTVHPPGIALNFKILHTGIITQRTLFSIV
uniref:Uncharacterized protein n=1 Tax=Anguilla anguilla TaxID=7936 RepID=A0A0E9QZG0_ANGAN